jgi:pimeloyl-ACP methyl ester carboxylesterase
MKRWSWILGGGCLLAAVALAAPAPLATIDQGRGPTLLLLHSRGGTRETWKPTAEKLAGYHVVLADLPGHGDTPLPDPFSMDAAADQVAATLGTLKAESTVVVGQGMGGVLALRALAAHPERARGLVLVDVSLVGQGKDATQRDAILQFVDQNYRAFLRMTFGHLGRDSLQNLRIESQAAKVPSPTMRAFFEELLMLDANMYIRRARVPILVVATDRVWPADMDSVTFMTQMGYVGAPALSIAHVSDAGFLVATEQPDTLAALIARFTTRVLRKESPPAGSGAERHRR